MAAHHKSNLGKFGESLVVDQNGYTYTTAEEWLAAPVDISAEDRADVEYMQQWATEQAERANAALTAAEADAAKWQRENAS
jgi:hypothetical protein